MRTHRLPLLALLALFTGSCAPDGPSAPAAPTAQELDRIASATTLRDAIGLAAAAYRVPSDLLAALAWSETRFGDPAADHDHDRTQGPGEGDDPHGNPSLGSLGLRTGVDSARGAGVDTAGRAMALLGASREALGTRMGLGVAGAAAVLAELGAETGARTDDLASWAEAVARFSGVPERPLQVSYAEQVFAVLREGVTDTTYTGEPLSVTGRADLAPVASLLGVNQAAQHSTDYGPALWTQASTSNFSVGRSGGGRPRFVVIHTMQGSYAGTISWFRNPAARVSAHYNVRSSDGQITQMVRDSDTGWHAGNSYYNANSIGIEHEGFVADPGRWYTTAMYTASARLVRALCDRYNIPIDRQHIIGHYQIPRSGSGAPCGTTATGCGGAGGHTDPGNGWDWNRFLALVRSNGATTPPPPPPPPPPPTYAATYVGMSCPTTAVSGERPVAWVEYRNTGTATWDVRNTRLGTTNPRDHRGIFFDMINWTSTNRPTPVDRATAPGAVGRFSFVLGIPTVAAEMTLSENYGLVQESMTWFGPSDTTVRCSVRVRPRPTPDAGTPPPPPIDAGRPTPVDASPPDPVDAGSPDPVDAGPSPDTDSGVTPDPVDAGLPPPLPDPTEEDAGVDPEPAPAMEEESGCGCRVGPGLPGRSSGPAPGVGALALGLGVALSRRRRSP